jgi:hypothetical protein
LAEGESERKREVGEVVEKREAVLEVKLWYAVHRRKKRSRREKRRRKKRREGVMGGFRGEIERISLSERARLYVRVSRVV